MTSLITPSSPSSSARPDSDSHAAALDALWLVMHGAYGSKAAVYGATPNAGWRMVLEDVSPADIVEGTRAMLREYPEWPPTAGEFRNLCTGSLDIARLDDGQLVALAGKLGVKTIGRTDRDGIVRDVQRAMRRDDGLPAVTN